MTRCHLDKQSLDKRAINHAFSDGFTIVNFAFILPPLLTQQTSLAFTMVKLEKRVTLKNPFTMVNFHLPWLKKLKCDLNQYRLVRAFT